MHGRTGKRVAGLTRFFELHGRTKSTGAAMTRRRQLLGNNQVAKVPKMVLRCARLTDGAYMIPDCQ